jgi:ketosteroid isomerase-like protein
MKRLLFVATLAIVCLLPVWAQTAAEKELIKVENDWGNAWVKNDGKALDLLYATEYLATDASAKTWTKTEGIKEDISSKYTGKSFRLSELKAHVYGQAGIVTGRNTVKYTAEGKEGGDDIRFTDVFVKRDGRWQCVATQGSRIEKK